MTPTLDEDRPTWRKPCERCGPPVERWRGQGEVDCPRRGASYDAGGQRLRDDWRENLASSDNELDELEGFELRQLRAEQ
ncbi:hypothetical protein [Flexivirga sp.]|uniref:hypothetical protein n=1 Tax=Flexivirga sp. TaxID=1962927 RepID=UPI003F7F9A63